jgi:hypothetical protein
MVSLSSLKSAYIILKIIFLPHKKTMSPTLIDDGDVCGEIITTYSGKHTKHIICEQNV